MKVAGNDGREVMDRVCYTGAPLSLILGGVTPLCVSAGPATGDGG